MAGWTSSTDIYRAGLGKLNAKGLSLVLGELYYKERFILSHKYEKLMKISQPNWLSKIWPNMNIFFVLVSSWAKLQNLNNSFQ